MRETVITCDRCGREFRYQRRGDLNRDEGWRLVWPLGVRSRTRELTVDDAPLHVCLDCLFPEEIEEIAESEARELGYRLGPDLTGWPREESAG